MLSKTEIIVFDKTGTLTEGIFEVQEIKSKNISKDELLEIVAYTENYSNHPIAESVKRAFGKKIDESRIEKVEELSGFGMLSKLDEKEVLVGNEKLMKEKNIEYEKCDEIGTIIYVAINNKYSGYIVISDKIKKDSKILIKELKKNGIKKTVMLTGDRKIVGDKISNELCIDEVHSELLPNQKVEKVEGLKKEKSDKGKLAFVGDRYK